MAIYDCFNGDADGICALLQWRLTYPNESILITGVKRKQNLLDKLHAGEQDRVNVFDVSLEKNRTQVVRLLRAGAQIFYCDHHFTGEIPQHTQFTGIFDTNANVCTSLLINQYLQGKFPEWAIVGAFGDNLHHSAQKIAQQLQLSDAQIKAYQKLGVYINYNGYGEQLSDLHFSPDALYKILSLYSNPNDFLHHEKNTFHTLKAAYNSDLDAAKRVQPYFDDDTCTTIILPNKIESRRISGVFANHLANQNPNKAHIIAIQKDQYHFTINLRAPLNNKQGAVSICRQFPLGGGREAAAGINQLPKENLPLLLDKVRQYYR